MSAATTLLTADELDQFPDNGKRREIVGGELHVSPAPAEHHQDLSMRLSYFLYEMINLSGAGKAYAAPVDVRFSPTDQVQPDLLAIWKERLDIYQGHVVNGTPDIVIEILSSPTARYDEVEKKLLYADNGVPEYWIVDPKLRILTIYRLAEDGYVEVEPENGPLRSTAIVDFMVDPASHSANVEPN
jgi:Uma2 family endonuclease